MIYDYVHWRKTLFRYGGPTGWSGSNICTQFHGLWTWEKDPTGKKMHELKVSSKLSKCYGSKQTEKTGADNLKSKQMVEFDPWMKWLCYSLTRLSMQTLVLISLIQQILYQHLIVNAFCTCILQFCAIFKPKGQKGLNNKWMTYCRRPLVRHWVLKIGSGWSFVRLHDGGDNGSRRTY